MSAIPRASNCIKFGNVLIDENFESFILCLSCHNDFKDLDVFRQHLEKCQRVEDVFKKDKKIEFDPGKKTELFANTQNGLKRYNLYELEDIKLMVLKNHSNNNLKNNSNSLIDLTEIEEEMLDPRWYENNKNSQKKVTTVMVRPTTLSNEDNNRKILKYDELVEAVTPFVQFKENVKKNTTTTTINKTFGKGVTIKRKLPLEGNNESDAVTVKKLPTVTTNGKPTLLLINNKTQAAVALNRKPETVAFQNKIKPDSINNNNNIKSNLNAMNVDKNPNKQNDIKQIKQIIVNKSTTSTNGVVNVARPPPPLLARPPPLLAKRTLNQQQQQQTNPVTATKSVAKMQLQQKLQAKIELQQKIQAKPSEPQQHVQMDKNESLNNLPATKSSQNITTINSNQLKANTETDQILNKLQTLGLQIKRTQPPTPQKPEVTDNTPLETQHMLQKLAKNGMKVQRVTSKDVIKSVPTRISDSDEFNTTAHTIIKPTATNLTTLPIATTNNNNSVFLKDAPRFNKNLTVKKM